jgi:serine/threonine protein kinase
MATNRLTLIRQLQPPFVLAERFSQIEVKNCNPATGEHLHGKGCLSVVFGAYDTQTQRAVALKFFDLDYYGMQQQYRLALFQRECDLLAKLVGKQRCLQLLTPMEQLPLTVSNPTTGDAITLPCPYFAIEWLEHDIDDYFHKQQDYDAIIKLAILRDASLAVFALHRAELAHRDIKVDNLRRTERPSLKCIIAIDLGTAAAHDSLHAGSPGDYANPVGAPAYAPLEARCGLSGVRKLGRLADYYALGCLLFELFNIDFFFMNLIADSGYKNCFTECQHHIIRLGLTHKQESVLMKEWRKTVKRFKRQVTIPPIDSSGSSVPAATRDQLDRLLKDLTTVDFDDRLCDENKTLQRIDSAVKILRNNLAERRQRELKEKHRRMMEEKTLAKQQRLNTKLAGNKQLNG